MISKNLQKLIDLLYSMRRLWREDVFGNEISEEDFQKKNFSEKSFTVYGYRYEFDYLNDNELELYVIDIVNDKSSIIGEYELINLIENLQLIKEVLELNPDLIDEMVDLLKDFIIDNHSDFWSFAYNELKEKDTMLLGYVNWPKHILDTLSEEEKNLITSLNIGNKYNLLENKLLEFKDFLLEKFDDFEKFKTVLNQIKDNSKYKHLVLFRIENSNKDEIIFRFLGQSFLLKRGEGIDRLEYQSDGNFEHIGLDNSGKDNLYKKLKIASSFKNETGATEYGYLNDVYDPYNDQSFWKQSLEYQKKKDPENMYDLKNMADNFDPEYGQDLTEDEKNLIKSMAGINKYNLFELKKFENFDYDRDGDDIINVWLESNNFYEEAGKWNCNSTFSIIVPDYLVNESGKLKVQFGKVEGNFEISNVGLMSLKGCPEEVGGTFECDNTLITDLKFLPNKINGNLYLSNNRLKNVVDLKNSNVHGYINISYNLITSLEGAPYIINGSFLCNNNKLTNLEYCPGEIHGKFNCSSNPLSTLNGAPKKVETDKILNSLEEVPDVEIEFYSEIKVYNNYYEDLLNWILSNKRAEKDLDQIDWPEGFLKEHGNIIKSITAINKYNMDLKINKP